MSKFRKSKLENLTQDNILDFLSEITSGKKETTRFTYYSTLSSFFVLAINSFDLTIVNPCKLPGIKKLFKRPRLSPWKILEKESVDEIIFRTINRRDRLLLELMARGGMRVGEVLKLMPEDIHGHKLILKKPKSGREMEIVYLPKKVADRLRDYVQLKEIETESRIFPISHVTAWRIVQKAGRLIGIKISFHDFRRHAATFASRAGVPIEIVSKVILRHSDLSTTQRYLGKISDVEATRWIENIHS